MSTAVIRAATSGEIAISRSPTREQAQDVPRVMHEILAPFRQVLEALEYSSGVPLEPSVQAVVEAYPRLLAVLEIEMSAYVKAYADKCDALEDQVLSLRLHIRRMMDRFGAR